MQLTPYIRSLQADIAAIASLGDPAVAAAGERIAEALESSLRLRLLDALSEAASEVESQLDGPRVDVRIIEGEPVLRCSAEEAGPAEPAPEAAPDDDVLVARFTLRMPDSLKVAAELAATRGGLSLNAWLVRAVMQGLESQRRESPGGGRRLTGYQRS